jgi:hypothetical protein
MEQLLHICHQVHSVLHCKHSGCLGMTVNRDEDVSHNKCRMVRVPWHFAGGQYYH